MSVHDYFAELEDLGLTDHQADAMRNDQDLWMREGAPSRDTDPVVT